MSRASLDIDDGLSYDTSTFSLGLLRWEQVAKSKADLAAAVYKVHGGLSRRESIMLVDLVLDRIRAALRTGRPVLISGFGTFRVLDRRPRLGRNPRTGEAVAIAPARRAVFRPSRLMVRGMNPAKPGRDRSDV